MFYFKIGIGVEAVGIDGGNGINIELTPSDTFPGIATTTAVQSLCAAAELIRMKRVDSQRMDLWVKSPEGAVLCVRAVIEAALKEAAEAKAAAEKAAEEKATVEKVAAAEAETPPPSTETSPPVVSPLTRRAAEDIEEALETPPLPPDDSSPVA